MRIVLAKSQLVGPISGADEALVRYAIQLHRLGHLHSVVVLHRPAEDDPYLHRLVAAGITVDVIAPRSRLRSTLLFIRRCAVALGLVVDVTVTTPNRVAAWRQTLPRRIWRQLWHFVSTVHVRASRRYFRRTRADVVHVVASDAGAVVLIRAATDAGRPVLFHELGTPDYLPELHAHYVEFAASARAASEVAALSPSLARGWETAFGLTRPARVVPLLHVDAGPRTPTSSSDDGVIFGYAARLERGKGPIVLLEAFARARQRVPGIRLRVSGVGPLEHAARERAHALALGDSCEFLGYTLEEDKRALLESFDVFVLPTLAEGTPNSLIEVMMLGLPIVATTVGGIPDMLAGETSVDGEDAALLVRPNDVDSLAGALVRLASDASLRERLGAAARRRYLATFHPDAVLTLLLEEYARMTDAHGQVACEPSGHPWRITDAVVQRHEPVTDASSRR